MLSRTLAILIATWLPTLAIILPIGPVHFWNAMIAGSLATVLSFLSLSNDRFRIATAIVGGWVALSPFVLWSTLLEQVLTVSWGVAMFVFMAGPFSASPQVSRTRVPTREAPPAGLPTDLPIDLSTGVVEELPRAA